MINIEPQVFKKHLSPFLQWLWRYEDFVLKTVRRSEDFSIIEADFSPKSKWLIFLLLKFGITPRLSMLASTRLINIAAIIGAGFHLKKPYKDGDVILRGFEVSCNRPVYYDNSTLIKVTINLLEKRRVKGFYRYKGAFSVGDEEACHKGSIEGYYPAK